MLVFKESAYIENRKYYESVNDILVREYHDIYNKIEDIESFYIPSEVVSYLYRELDSVPEDNKIEFLSLFFNNALKNDIQTIKVWVSYLDSHMEERYVEDGEMMIEYRSHIKDTPLSIRGDERYDAIVFIECILKALHLEDNEVIKILNNIDYDNLKLPDKEFEDYEPVEEECEDRPYYEQRPRRYSI